MRAYIIRRVLQMIPVFFGVILLLFLIFHFAPGDVVSGMIDPKATPEQKAELREKLGVDEPFFKKFTIWSVNMLKGDLGMSYTHKREVSKVIADYVFPTFILAFSSLIVAVLVGVPIGILSATKQYSIRDYIFTFIAFIGVSLPSFFFALLVQKFFAIDHQWLPLFGLRDPLAFNSSFTERFFDMARHLVLPVGVLGLSSSATFMRYSRTSMLEVINMDYVRTARAKGLKEKVVIYKHAFRNSLIPIITLLGFWIPSLLSGAVMTESIFGLPGMGKLSVDAVMSRDYQVVLGINAMLTILTIVGALVADILYAVADPRVRYD